MCIFPLHTLNYCKFPEFISRPTFSQSSHLYWKSGLQRNDSRLLEMKDFREVTTEKCYWQVLTHSEFWSPCTVCLQLLPRTKQLGLETLALQVSVDELWGNGSRNLFTWQRHHILNCTYENQTSTPCMPLLLSFRFCHASFNLAACGNVIRQRLRKLRRPALNQKQSSFTEVPFVISSLKPKKWHLEMWLCLVMAAVGKGKTCSQKINGDCSSKGHDMQSTYQPLVSCEDDCV